MYFAQQATHPLKPPDMTAKLRQCILIGALVLCTDVFLLAQNPANILEGTWEMISRKEIFPDTTIDHGVFQGPSFKILNSTHFAFGRQIIINGAPQEEVFAGGGRYSLVGDSVYTEYIEYHSNEPLIGYKITFKCEVVGDLWYHSGVVGNRLLQEIWRRVR